jgi:hypothetical protein
MIGPGDIQLHEPPPPFDRANMVDLELHELRTIA